MARVLQPADAAGGYGFGVTGAVPEPMPGIEVSLGLWQDRPAREVVTTARIADELGFPRIWVGEMATYDAFALATHLGAFLETAELVIGPLAVSVRDPMTIAVGAASVADLTSRPVSIALGTSSAMVVEDWHGRSRMGSAAALGRSAQAVRRLVDGNRALVDGAESKRGYRLRLGAPKCRVVIAAFGDKALRAAVECADELVLNLVGPEQVRRVAARCREIAAELGRPVPRINVWVPAAVHRDGVRSDQVNQLRRGLVPYLAAPGYSDMFERAGFAPVVERARAGTSPHELLADLGVDIVSAVGIVGTVDAARTQLAAYRCAGADCVVLVPSATDADPAGSATMEAVMNLWTSARDHHKLVSYR